MGLVENSKIIYGIFLLCLIVKSVHTVMCLILRNDINGQLSCSESNIAYTLQVQWKAHINPFAS